MKIPFATYFSVLLFALAGVFCGVFTVVKWREARNLRQSGIETVGTVTDLLTRRAKKSTTYAPVVTFKTRLGEEITYESDFYTNINPPQIGDPAKLWYDPTDPHHVYLAGAGRSMILLLLVFTLVFGGLGAYCIVWLVRKTKTYSILKQRGQTIQAALKEIQEKKRNLDSPYVVVATWVDPITRQPYEFSSENQSSGLNIGKITNTGSVPVIIDPQNPKDYWVDLRGF